jgi:hypothetical protein
VSTTTIDRLFATFLLALGIYVVWNALGYGYMRDATPGPGFFPFWVGLAIAGLSLVNLVRSFRGAERVESEFDAAGVYRTLAIIGVIVVFIVITPWVGMLIASGLIIPPLAFIIQPNWTPRLTAIIFAIAAGFPIVCHFLFGVYLQVPLVRGIFGI